MGRPVAGRGAFIFEPGQEQCPARDPYHGRCALLPHAHWMPHSWVPWSLAIEIQSRQRDQHARTGRCDACPTPEEANR